ncbi:MAG TPA: glycoside hydrolase family 3 C-terminal domain-containing protein [Dinghuibacter sp.]|uniref:glycoside hydrolase family 3 protein n=1 Tax=Dinghuibacter sp. TaxID=2024697 RepID=UPI002B86BD63|nr:glycoside hydrolase family 3 C-terminal domain-containing protein [Dinghuibacter sp.]HTJ14001.1 glycoside hydrolase family 3 C-terminal domain-containing protein [Dinghuibacter sp.]
MKRTIAIACIMAATQATTAQTYKDPTKSFSERAQDLVSRMTLEEKVSQMMNNSPAIDRLDIPAYNWWNEGLHGVARTSKHATVFPQAIGNAATFDELNLHNMATMISIEARALHNEFVREGKRGIYEGLTFWSPNINIFRDPRWGRGQETYGEDPYLTGRMGMALVEGFQGNDPHYLRITACAKHFAVHSGPESTRHTFDANISPYDLRDTYLPAFRNLVVDARVASVMCAYNALGGQPCCGNDLLMTNILYNEWHFKGYVTSDCGAIDDFYRGHKTSADKEHASSDAVLHGTDIECGSSYKSLVDAVHNGLLPESKIDSSVLHLLEIRFRLGMFDQTPMDTISMAQVESPEHQAQALLMARESIVLLKNDRLLPLNRQIKKIAVVGPNANDSTVVLGNYNGFPTHTVTVLEGIKSKVPNVYYQKGVDYVNGDIDPDLIKNVQDADVIVFVGGISPRLEGEEMPVKVEGFSGGDRTSISIPAIQTKCLQALQATGKPVVLVMMTGSALSTEWASQNLPAIVDAWYGGEAAGTAVADVLFGDYNPAGRLPVTFYRSVDDLPAFDDYSMAGRTYRYFKGTPLYPFGYGLSYTTFQYEELKAPETLDIQSLKALSIAVTLRNTGRLAGDEVVQLYVKHETGPKWALKGFNRVHDIQPGGKAGAALYLTPRDLAQVDEQGRIWIKPGLIDLYAGGGQPLPGAKVLHKQIRLTGQPIELPQ